MKPDIYKLVEKCVEDGVAYGIHRAYKHNDNPTPEQIEDKVVQAVMFEIGEWFKFDPVGDE